MVNNTYYSFCVQTKWQPYPVHVVFSYTCIDKCYKGPNAPLSGITVYVHILLRLKHFATFVSFDGQCILKRLNWTNNAMHFPIFFEENSKLECYSKFATQAHSQEYFFAVEYKLIYVTGYFYIVTRRVLFWKLLLLYAWEREEWKLWEVLHQTGNHYALGRGTTLPSKKIVFGDAVKHCMWRKII